MLPAVSLLAEAVSTFICGLYTGFRWAHTDIDDRLHLLGDTAVIWGMALLIWLVRYPTGSLPVSAGLALAFFFAAPFPQFVSRFGGALRVGLLAVAGISGVVVARGSGRPELGILVAELALVLPAAGWCLPRRMRAGTVPGGGLIVGTVVAFGACLGVPLLLVESFLLRSGLQTSSLLLSLTALSTVALWALSTAHRRGGHGEVSGLLALGVLHEYRKLVGRLQLLSDFALGQGEGFQAAERPPELLFLIRDEIRLSGESLPSLDLLYGRASAPGTTRLPEDLQPLVNLAGPVFRSAGRSLKVGRNDSLSLRVPPAVFLHCLLILLRNALEHSSRVPGDVDLGWFADASGSRGVLRISNRAADAVHSELPAPGWGSGLRIARELARRHGGELRRVRRGHFFVAELRFPLSR